MDLEVLETKCHVRSQKPWKRCDIRPFMETHISGNCNTTVLHTPQGFSYLYSYDCILIPDQPETLLKTCPDCPLLLSVDSKEALQAAQLTLHKYNTENTRGSQFRVQSITRASQSTAGKSSFVEYTILETDCTSEQENAGLCQVADANKEPVGFCVGAVYHYGNRENDVQVSCEIFHFQGVEMPRPGTVGGVAGRKKEPNVISAQKPAAVGPKPPVTKDPASKHSDPAQKPVAVGPKPPVTKDPAPKHSDPGQKEVVPESPNTKPPGPIQPATVPDYPELKELLNQSSSESNSDSESSEEIGDSIIRPAEDFWYKSSRLKRQVSPSVRPENIPEFLSVFPSTPSPFRSCPGAPRYTTV